MTVLHRLLLIAAVGLNAACASLSPADTARIETLVVAVSSDEIVCQQADTCAQPSPLRELGVDAANAAAEASARSVALRSAHAATSETAHEAVAPGAESVTTNAAATQNAATAGAPDKAQHRARLNGGTGPVKTATATTPVPSPHHALILDYGQDALLARLNLIRSATRSIDIQTYIYDEDDVGHLVLDELLIAARRGVKVRLLVDQLSALKRVDTLAALAGAHTNFEMRIFNPVLGRARISYPMYAYASACCWRQLNQRMHNKLFIVDGLVAITGGRNYQNAYYDWDNTYNFRDRDLLVAGLVVGAMSADFEAFWAAKRSRKLTALTDVGQRILRDGVPALVHPKPDNPQRIEAISRDANDQALVRSRLVDAAIPVQRISYIADPHDKHRRNGKDGAPASQRMYDLVASTEQRVLLQTPYLVMSKPAQRLFRNLQKRAQPPRVLVSTNSLAATDAFIPYALSYKYKRRYLRDYKFDIYEFKPFPQDAPIDVEATGAVNVVWREDGTAVVSDQGAAGEERLHPTATTTHGSGRLPLAREYSALRYSRPNANEPVPLKDGGVRFGLHAKSLVIDGRYAVIGTHNFDPRGDNYNTEGVVVIEDEAFVSALTASIERDMLPANAWTIARRDKPRVLSGLEYSLSKVSEYLPVFDFWPTRYATSYEFKPGPECPAPLSPRDPNFRRCYEPVGDFPGVGIVIRPLTRIFTAFGAGLAPIL